MALTFAESTPVLTAAAICAKRIMVAAKRQAMGNQSLSTSIRQSLDL